MKTYHLIAILTLFAVLTTSLTGQDTIYLTNPSFEDIPHQGSSDYPYIRDWTDCGPMRFPRETPPDIHPRNFWDVTARPFHGSTYLGLVARYNETYEGLSQRLDVPLEADKCYNFSVHLAMSEVYLSSTHRSSNSKESFTTPCVLRVYGGTGYCNETQLLAESPPIDHTDWRQYDFMINPKGEYRYITVEIFYNTPSLFAYNGNLLVDNISPFVITPCPGEEILAATAPVNTPPPPNPYKETVQDPDPEPTAPAVIAPESRPAVATVEKPSEVSADMKILKDLDGSKIKAGQVIQVEQLYFPQDSANFEETSLSVLDEIYRFLGANPEVIVEIGGHTNGLPEHAYCDRLSTERAQSVAEYLAGRGISPYRLKYKGYGKRNPIASNKTRHGRSLNQRVEIKILSLEG